MNAYCLFCETARCDTVARIVAEKLGCKAISPKQVQHTWSKGKMVDYVRDLLPGYVFLYLESGKLNIQMIQPIQGIIRCLSTPDRQYELTGNDERFAMMLLQRGGIIGKTKVYEEGQMIRICEGAFAGVETRILKVNHQKGRMQIEIPFAGMPVKTWVEYEIVTDEL